MSEPNSSELRDLILGLDRKMDALDKKMDVRFAEQAGEIKRVEEKLTGEIKRVEVEVKRVEEKLTGEIKRVEVEVKRVEEKLTGEIKRVEEKINGIDKRLGNEEFISRSAFTAVIVGVMAGLVKYLFFPSTF